jgi:hypothetical protein
MEAMDVLRIAEPAASVTCETRRICNAHPASEVVKNQCLAIAKNTIFTARLASNQVDAKFE